MYLLITGIAQVIFAFALDVSAGSRILLFISGAASLILAVLAFRHFGKDQTTAVLLLAIWIGVGFIFRGTATTVAAISERGLPGRGWLIFYGVISVIAGVVVMGWPFDSIVVMAITIGVWLVIMGVFEIVSAFGIRKDANQTPGFPPGDPRADPQGQQGRSTALTRHQPADTMPPRHRLTCAGRGTASSEHNPAQQQKRRRHGSGGPPCGCQPPAGRRAPVPAVASAAGAGRRTVSTGWDSQPQSICWGKGTRQRVRRRN